MNAVQSLDNVSMLGLSLSVSFSFLNGIINIRLHLSFLSSESLTDLFFKIFKALHTQADLCFMNVYLMSSRPHEYIQCGISGVLQYILLGF